jgi:hypothetical protein
MLPILLQEQDSEFIAQRAGKRFRRSRSPSDGKLVIPSDSGFVQHGSGEDTFQNWRQIFINGTRLTGDRPTALVPHAPVCRPSSGNISGDEFACWRHLVQNPGSYHAGLAMNGEQEGVAQSLTESKLPVRRCLKIESLGPEPRGRVDKQVRRSVRPRHCIDQECAPAAERPCALRDAIGRARRGPNGHGFLSGDQRCTDQPCANDAHDPLVPKFS